MNVSINISQREMMRLIFESCSLFIIRVPLISTLLIKLELFFVLLKRYLGKMVEVGEILWTQFIAFTSKPLPIQSSVLLKL